jgi:hypothetical protein
MIHMHQYGHVRQAPPRMRYSREYWPQRRQPLLTERLGMPRQPRFINGLFSGGSGHRRATRVIVVRQYYARRPCGCRNQY